LEGTRILYYENGKKEIEENYINGVMEGEYKSYYLNGEENVVAQFKNGVMTGMVKRYFESGTLMEEVTFEENEENGPFKEYYENGQIQWEGNYLNGDNEFGLLTHYNESGVIIKKMQCDSNAICQTIWTPEKGDIPLKIVLESN
jgi:antitoxin component YwqK of YwqJK toxin-antitoxin module